MDVMSETGRLAQLNRIRRIATGLLVLMALLFVATRMWRPDAGPWLAFVAPLGAFAEAAMIGALADWFAVTALFRRPLGLPIPHTDVIATNKDRIASSLADFLSNNFMTHEVISHELSQVDFSAAVSDWMAQDENSAAVATRQTESVPALLEAVESRVELEVWLRQALVEGLRHIGIARVLAEGATIMVAQQRHQQLYDRLVRMAALALEEHRPMLREKFMQARSRWIPQVVDEIYFNRIMHAVEHMISAADAPDSIWRERLETLLADWIEKLRNSPEHEERLQALIAGILEHPSFADHARHLIDDLRQGLLQDTSSGDSRIAARLALLLRAGAAVLQHDAALSQQLNGWMREVITDAIVGQRKTIAALVERVIAKWDGPTVARKLELQVGRDLQYIRINGTLVGGAVGLILHYLSLALF